MNIFGCVESKVSLNFILSVGITGPPYTILVGISGEATASVISEKSVSAALTVASAVGG
jgi:CheY-specific phosphatase CheX